MSPTVTAEAWQAIALTLKLATLTSFLLLLIATPLAWWLSQTRSGWRSPISALVTLPIVLPPTVLGFYVLVLLGPHGWIGQFTQAIGLGVLSWFLTGRGFGAKNFYIPG